MTAPDKPMSAEELLKELDHLLLEPSEPMRALATLIEWAAAIRADERARLLAECDKLTASWCRASVIKLVCGEMTAQELRTAQAVARAIRDDLSRLAAFAAPKEPCDHLWIKATERYDTHSVEHDTACMKCGVKRCAPRKGE